MSQQDKGSRHQLLRVIEKDPRVIFDLVESGLTSLGIEFKANEQFLPSQFNPNESTIEGFIQGISTEFTHFDLNSLISWWAPVKQKPSWDFISTCNVNGTKGILLVEAKSHYGEMEVGRKTISVDFSKNVSLKEIRTLVKNRLNKNSIKLSLTTNELTELIRALAESSLLDDKLLKSFLDKLRHHDKIGDAVSEARGALSNYCSDVMVSRDNHYQLSNRIAYTWKLASMGIPTILLYLGFINDPAWISINDHFKSDQKWIEETKNYFAQVGASELLDKKIVTLNNGSSMYFCISSLGAD